VKRLAITWQVHVAHWLRTSSPRAKSWGGLHTEHIRCLGLLRDQTAQRCRGCQGRPKPLDAIWCVGGSARQRRRPQVWGIGRAFQLAGLLFSLWADVGFGQQAKSQPAWTGAGFRFDERSQTSLGLWEGDKPVLVYHHGRVRAAGVPDRFTRSTYVHPLYGLDGEVLTDDFPADHYHHRGLFWAWPHVTLAGVHYDLWMLRGIEQRFEHWLARTVTASNAVLGVANGWYAAERKVMAEQAWFRVHPATTTGRLIDLEFVWEPIDQPVTLAGAEGKSYGGLTLRFARGTNTVITVPPGAIPRDLAMTNLPWADLTRRWAGQALTSGVAILVHPSHPDFPPQWLTRHYGVLCLGWPGVKPKTLQPGQPVRCRYRLWIHRGQPSVAELQQAFALYRAGTAAVAAAGAH
jgi:hypothetical protein